MNNEEYFQYDDEEIAYLKKKDKALEKLINLVGPVRRKIVSDPFQGLVHAIIGQQISTTAHESVWKRFKEKFSPLSPEHIAGISPECLKAAGLSLRKASYIHTIAEDFFKGRLNSQILAKMSDDDLSACLISIPGVGRWTVEMLLIFTFQRKNILSYGDYAIQRGLRMLYKKRDITPEFFEKVKKRYYPFATLASLYLWEVASGKYDEYIDLQNTRTCIHISNDKKPLKIK